VICLEITLNSDAKPPSEIKSIGIKEISLPLNNSIHKELLFVFQFGYEVTEDFNNSVLC